MNELQISSSRQQQQQQNHSNKNIKQINNKYNTTTLHVAVQQWYTAYTAVHQLKTSVVSLLQFLSIFFFFFCSFGYLLQTFRRLASLQDGDQANGEPTFKKDNKNKY